MTTNQPKWRLIANLGDRHPIAYGGAFVYRDLTHVYTEECEYFDAPPDNVDIWTVYRFTLDRCEQITLGTKYLLVPFGFPQRTDLPHDILNYVQWFSDSIESIADNQGIKADELRADFCSADPIKRAFAYLAVGQYEGFDNLDSYPLTFKKQTEMRRRYKSELRSKIVRFK